MNSGWPETPEAILIARRAMEEFPQIQLVRDLTFSYVADAWTLAVSVKTANPTEFLTAETTWWICIDPRYPWGDIEIYPDKTAGIQATFPHQDLNTESNEPLAPWRDGDVCLKVPSFAFGRRVFESDPLGHSDRLRWYFERLVGWIDSATTGRLFQCGDPFELPQFRPSAGLIGFAEGPEDLSFWLSEPGIAGIAEFLPLRSDPNHLVVWQFHTPTGNVLREIGWGERLLKNKLHPVLGVWIKLDRLPVLPPYQAPMTWGELRRVVAAQGADLDEILIAALPDLRDKKLHFAIIGFPIPELEGGPFYQMHWQALRLPGISAGEDYQRGFRKSERAYWMRDRGSVFRDSDKIAWMKTENWADKELGSRGQFDRSIASLRTTLLGAGAIGAPVAELLVRGGVREMNVIDGDKCVAGNLVRHTLLLDHIGDGKAVSIASRLNRISPMAKATAIPVRFPNMNQDQSTAFSASQLVIDCTGSDDVIAALASQSFPDARWYWSVSISLGAKRLYAFSVKATAFPAALFDKCVAPWVQKDKRDAEDTEMVREGTGCWHPVFPGRADELLLMASVAVNRLTDTVRKGIHRPSFCVFQRNELDGVFCGVSLVENNVT